MKVLMISGDRNVLIPETGAFERLQLQKRNVEELDVFVWPQVHSKWQVWRAARTKKYDVITAQDPFWRGLLGLAISRRTGARLNVQVHADLSIEPFVRHIIAQIVLRHADSVRVVSEKLKRQVEKMGVRAPISVLPVFMDVELFRNVTRMPHAVPTILWIGRFEQEKDPFTALRVLRDVHAGGIPARLVMVGDGALKTDLQRASMGLPVEFTGWHSTVVSFLSQADVVLSTSRQESYGASVIESLAAGVPVVAPDVGIAREAGAIVVPREDLAAAVGKTLSSGERGRLALKLPSADEWARRWKESL